MKKFNSLLLLVFLFFGAYNIQGQQYNIKFLEVANDAVNGGNYDVKIQIKGSSTFKLASSSIFFTFNGDGLSNPTLVSPAHNFTSFPYNPIQVGEPVPDAQAAINIVYPVTESSFAQDVTSTFKDVATVRFTIDDITKTTGFNVFISGLAATVIYKAEGAGGIPPTGTYVTTNLDPSGMLEGLDTPLPVELSSFSANSVEGVKAQLNWETATEVNNYGFEIERSVVLEDAEFETATWEKVAFVKGHGNSNSNKIYSFTDQNLVGGSKFMYRLKQIDIDGTFEYSDAVEIEVLPSKYELFQNYPNPFNPTTNIKFSLPEDAKIAINIYNILGEKVASVLNEEVKAGYHQVDFSSNSAGYSIASGVYIYTIESKNFSQVKKMILMK